MTNPNNYTVTLEKDDEGRETMIGLTVHETATFNEFENLSSAEQDAAEVTYFALLAKHNVARLERWAAIRDTTTPLRPFRFR